MEVIKFLSVLFGLMLIGLVLYIIGMILWGKFLNWRAAKGKTVDVEKLRKNILRAVVAICALVGFLTLLDESGIASILLLLLGLFVIGLVLQEDYKDINWKKLGKDIVKYSFIPIIAFMGLMVLLDWLREWLKTSP